MMSIVIIHGPQGSGKSRRAAELLKHYGCTRIVEEWRPGQPLRDGDLALTHDEPPFPSGGAEVIDIETAKRAVMKATPS